MLLWYIELNFVNTKEKSVEGDSMILVDAIAKTLL
jgi:hypothetical protein